jgi:tRNA pseudouridine55 synthase
VSVVNGVLLVDKPEGLSSAEIVRVVKKRLAAEKVGHLGTLDPFASGLLPLCLGTATKLAQFLMAERKTYTGTIKLGVETDTLDATGVITATALVPPSEPTILQDLERRFSGDYWQTPPMYSALKRNGVPLYKFARRGIEVDRAPRKVTIEKIRLEQVADDILRFSLSCSKGTYVRSLAADLGAVLGCGAHLLTLRRTSFGPFQVSAAVRWPLPADGDILPFLSLSQALGHYRSIALVPQAVLQLRHGQQDVLHDLPSSAVPGEIVRLLSSTGEAVAVVQWQEGQWRLVRVL